MLSAPRPPRQRRDPFLIPPWGDDHPALRRIDADLPAGHHARWLARAVAQLDLTAFRRSYAGRGSDAYPVEPLLAFVLLAYSQGLLSPAEWARRARYDDPSKWLLRGLQPSRSQLYAFRDRAEPFLDDWHAQLLRWAVAEGVTAATRGSLDGTFVASLASRHRLLSPRRVDRRLVLLELLVWLDGVADAADLAARLRGVPQGAVAAAVLGLGLPHGGVPVPALWEALADVAEAVAQLQPSGAQPGPPRLPAWVPASVAGRRRVLRRYRDAQQRLAQRLEPYRRKERLSKKDEQALGRLKVSLTDPEAALGWDKAGTYRPLYNVPLVQATDAPLTLAWDVLARNNDDGLLRPMAEKAAAQLGRPLAEVLVDGAFVSVGEVAWCEGQGVTVYAPPKRAGAAREALAQAQGDAAGPRAKGAKLPKAAFRYDPAEQAYYCPQGKRLGAVSHTTEKRQNGIELPVVVYRAARQDCQACPQQPGCTSSARRGRVVKRYEGEEALERLERRMAEPANQQVYRLRGQTVELGYADLKEHRGLRVFRCFGRRRARAQAGLVILASNGLAILRALHRRESAEQQPAQPEKQPA
jgi:transposase